MTAIIDFMVTASGSSSSGWPARRVAGASGRVLVISVDGRVATCRVRMRDRVVAAVRGYELDRRLARGEPPELSAVMALRATRLVRARSRRSLARTLRSMIEQAVHPGPTTPIPVCVSSVRGALDELRGLCERLEAPGSVSASGVAQLRGLISDGAGPLYWSSPTNELGERLRSVLAELNRFDSSML